LDGVRHTRPLKIAALAVGLAVVAVIAAQQLAGGVTASDFEPGSERDPLVAKSYVDRYAKFELLSVEAGRAVLPANTGAEIVVRSGRAVAIAGEAGGLADVTAGRDIGDGAAIPLNHLLVVPRADGRGLKASTDLILMIRGDYVLR